jgi:hypothetical protein
MSEPKPIKPPLGEVVHGATLAYLGLSGVLLLGIFAGPGAGAAGLAVAAVAGLFWYLSRPPVVLLGLGEVSIRHRGRTRSLPFSEIAKAEQVDAKELNFIAPLKIPAYGVCPSRTLGPIRAKITRETGLLLLTLKSGERFLLSPSDMEFFLRALNP